MVVLNLPTALGNDIHNIPCVLYDVRVSGDSVMHSFVCNNTGNVALRALSITGLDLTAVNCSLGDPGTTPVANPLPRLEVGQVMSCTGNFTFSQLSIEQGNASHVTRATSVNINPSTAAAFSQQISLAGVTVPNLPQLTAGVHSGSPTCNMPTIERESRLGVRADQP